MGAYEPDEDLARGVEDLGHQPEVVAADVEHGPRPDGVRVREVAADVDEVLPLRPGSHLEPRPERHLGLRMPFPELPEPPPGDDPHRSMFAYCELARMRAVVTRSQWDVRPSPRWPRRPVGWFRSGGGMSRRSHISRTRRSQIAHEARRACSLAQARGRTVDEIQEELLRSFPGELAAGEARMYAHGWTVGVVREGLQALAAEEGLESSGLQYVDVTRWLRGEVYPRESLERLCRLFRCHQAQLGWPP